MNRARKSRRTLGGFLILLVLPVSTGAVPAPSKPNSERTADFDEDGVRKAARDTPAIRARGRGGPWLHLDDGRPLPTRLPDGSRAARARSERSALPLALAAADFDEDGVPDLAVSFAVAAAGFVTIHQGNVDAIYPNAPEARARRAAGKWVDAPFLPEARSFDTAEPADFLVAGDFNADGHQDLAIAALRGETMTLYAGDGAGGFASARALALPGEVTALIAGDVNRRDGLADLVVGVQEPRAAAALVFEGPEGAFRAAPERIPLPEPPIDLSLAPLDDSITNGLAIGMPLSVALVHGRDRRLSFPEEDRRLLPDAVVERFSIPFVLEAMAAGDFDGDRGLDLALLDETGSIHVVAPADLKDLSRGTGRDPERVPRRAEFAAAYPRGTARAMRLSRAGLSGAPGDDLVLLDGPGRGLHIRSPHAFWATLDMPEEGAAALPMRLNGDALADLVVLAEGTAPISTVGSGRLLTFVVTNANAMGAGSLRQAILDANASPGADAIVFDIPGAGPHVIHPDPALGLPVVTGLVSIDATTEPGFVGTPLIVIDAVLGIEGLHVQGGGTTVRGLAIGRSGSSGLFLEGSGNYLVEGNFVGTDATGTIATGNTGFGIDIASATFTTIGGTATAARNVISGNLGGGIRIRDLAPNAVVQGNLIGLNRTGTAALPNAAGGVVIEGTSTVTIGGAAAGAGNVISGNNPGVDIDAGSAGVLVQGNRIGTDAAGLAGIGNSNHGILIRGSTNTIGGTAAGTGNVVSATLPDVFRSGIGVFGTLPTSGSNVIQGNLIGTDGTGAAALPNGNGVYIASADNLLGGSVTGARNVISGNENSGVYLNGADANRIVGNYIGTTLSGSASLGNNDGVFVLGATGNRIGGPGVLANVISGNLVTGITIQEGAGNLVEANFIGTDASGEAAIGNGSGIRVLDCTGSNQIGVKLGQGNVISGNDGEGLHIHDCSGTLVQGNLIGLDATGDDPISNSDGVSIDGGSGNVIGGVATELGNVISGNSNQGIDLFNSSSNRIQNNLIGLRLAGDAARPNAFRGLEINGGSGNLVGGGAGQGNAISGNLVGGIRIASDDTVISGNTIGLDVTRSFGIGNLFFGIVVTGSNRTTVGGDTLAEGNVIAFNGGEGVSLSTSTRFGNTVRMNSIFSNDALGIDLYTGVDGVTLNDPDDADAGTNHLQNFPDIGGVTTTGGSVQVTGSLDGTPLSSFTLDFYVSPTCDPSGYGEGRTWLGSSPTVTGPGGADATFLGTFLATVGAGEMITSTATSDDGSTSEFSTCLAASGVPPAAVSGVAFDSNPPETLRWDTAPGATQYHLYVGTRSTLPGLATQAADSCEAGVVQAPELALPPAGDPPPGSMIWVLVTAEGPYGEGPVQPASNGPRQLTSVGQCGASCVHDTCAQGNPLIPACDLCASIVCDADPACCANLWDAACVKAVRTVCRNLQCPESQGQCAHSLCQAGAPLSPGCDAPPLPVSCTAAICQADSKCCGQTWDETCIDKVSTVCGYNCL